MAKLYEVAKRYVRDQIESGRYSVGSRIPSEVDLVGTLGVSAITVRRALRDLAVEGLLVGRQGLGVFVADNRRIVRSLRTDFRTTIADDMQKFGFVPSIRKLSSRQVISDPETLECMGLPDDSILHCVEKLILANGEPVSLERDFLPVDLAEDLGEALGEDFLAPLLVENGFPLSFIDFRVAGGAASASDALLLDMAPGLPILKVRYVPKRSNGAPVATGFSIARADRFAYDFQVNVLRDFRTTAPKRTRGRAGGNGEGRIG